MTDLFNLCLWASQHILFPALSQDLTLPPAPATFLFQIQSVSPTPFSNSSTYPQIGTHRILCTTLISDICLCNVSVYRL